MYIQYNFLVCMEKMSQQKDSLRQSDTRFGGISRDGGKQGKETSRGFTDLGITRHMPYYGLITVNLISLCN